VGEVSDHQGFHGSSPKLNQVVGWVVSFFVGLDLSIAGAVPPALRYWFRTLSRHASV
jgi:hypothetical protein